MKAARIVGPRRFEILDIEAPIAQPGEVLVRMQHLSICGSDLRSYECVLPEGDYPDSTGYPCHECAGVIEESHADGLKAGQRVISLAYSGGLVEYSAVPAELIAVLPEDMDTSLGVLCQPLGTVIYALQRVGNVLGKRVVVLGQGPIGLFFTDLLVRQGASQVIVTDVVENRLETAQSLGASATINSSRENVADAVTELTKGEMADVVIDACGLPETNNEVFEVIRKQGTALIFGMPRVPDPITFDWLAMYDKLPTIMVVNSRRSNDVVPSVQSAVDLVARGGLDLSYMATHNFSLDEVGRAFELFSNRTDNVLKVLINV